MINFRQMRLSSGVTLSELVIAMAIIMMVAMVTTQFLHVNSRQSIASFNRLQANQYMEQIQNHLIRSNVSELKTEYNQFPQIITDSNFSAHVTIQPPDLDLSRKATIRIDWQSNQTSHFISMDMTLIPA